MSSKWTSALSAFKDGEVKSNNEMCNGEREREREREKERERKRYRDVVYFQPVSSSHCIHNSFLAGDLLRPQWFESESNLGESRLFVEIPRPIRVE